MKIDTSRNYSQEAQDILGVPTKVTVSNGIIREVEIWDGTKWVDVPANKQPAITAWARGK